MKITRALDLVVAEVDHAIQKHQHSFTSRHEGYAVVLEEVRELEDAVFFGIDRRGKPAYTKDEAVQVAASAIRFLMDLEEDE